ncbi:hypothetical protein WA158_004698 [Blastocystis sp. Blastoise]
MSEKWEENHDMLEKQENLSLIDANNNDASEINFIFQDETRIKIPLSFLKKYPNSLLFLNYKNSENYQKDEKAYYIDSPPFCIDTFIEIVCHFIPLNSFSFEELIEIDKTIRYFLRDDYIEDDDNLYGSKKPLSITIYNGFDDRIPYEYVYPSNLCEIFPKMERYNIKASYYPLKKYIPIKPTDIHYTLLYKEYKLQYYEKYYPESYWEYRHEHPEIEKNIFKEDQIHIYLKNIIENNESIEKIKDEEIHHEIIDIDIDIDEEIRNEKEEEKPDLYILSLSNYSREYNEEMIEKENKHLSLQEHKIDYCFAFSFIDCNGIIDKQHPILERDYGNYNDVLPYLLNISICKQIKYFTFYYNQPEFLLTVETPPFLRLLKDSIYSSLEIFNISKFINRRMYPEYLQLFIEIIRTHVFPNVTTLEIDLVFLENSTEGIDFGYLNTVLSLITRDRFPKLHIYILETFNTYFFSDPGLSQISVFIPCSLLYLIDTIQPSQNGYFDTLPVVEYIYNNLWTTKKQHDFTIKVDLCVYLFTQRWKQLYDNGFLTIGNIKYDFSDIFVYTQDVSSVDLSVYPFQSLTIGISSSHYDSLHNTENIYKNMNYSELKTLSIEYIHERIESKLEKLIDTDMDIIDDKIYHFFSLFSDNMLQFTLNGHFFRNSIFLNERYIKLPFWLNIQQLSLDLDSFNISDFLEFIECFKTDSILSLPLLNTFNIIFYKYNSISLNVFECFPSFSFYAHKPITSILIDSCFNEKTKDNNLYYKYIDNQLKQDYCKNIICLNLRIKDEIYMEKVIHLIINNSVPCLRYIQLTSFDNNNYSKYKELLDIYKRDYSPYLNVKVCNA